MDPEDDQIPDEAIDDLQVPDDAADDVAGGASAIRRRVDGI